MQNQTPPGSQNQPALSRLPEFINSIGDGFVVIDEQGQVEMANSMAHNMLDTNVLEGKAIKEVLHLCDSSKADVDLMELIKVSPTRFTSRDYLLKLGPNELMNVFISVMPLQAAFGKASGGGSAILIRDITHEKNLENERDEFISVASHEMRTPVAIAEGSISNAILLAERSHLPDTIMHVLKSSHQQLVFLGSLINDLATLSRADRGKLAVSLEEVDISQLVLQLEADYQPQASKKDLIFRADPVKDIPKIYGSKLYIYEILQNFVTNAIKYTEKGLITVKAELMSDAVTITVTDTGIGIDKAEQPKLFTKFFRSEDFRVRQAGGTGLGLYISAKLASLLGGSITFHSELNKGSTFSLQLPLSVYHGDEQTPKTVA